MTGQRLLAVLAALAAASCARPAATADEAPAAPPPQPQAQAQAQAVNPKVQVITYRCADGEALVAGYPAPDTAVVTWKDHAYTLKIARSGSGARYTGFGLQWWTKGLNQGTLAQLKTGEDVASDPGVACTAGDPAAPVEPPAPGTPGGLPDDRTPISEAPFSPTSAQGAADVVQTYYALIGEGKYAQSAALRSDGKAEDFSAYASYHAQVGAPGESEGGAGSIYIEVPVVIYGRYKTGAELHQKGKVVLRRVNNVDGATAAQLRWRIAQIELSGS